MHATGHASSLVAKPAACKARSTAIVTPQDQHHVASTCDVVSPAALQGAHPVELRCDGRAATPPRRHSPESTPREQGLRHTDRADSAVFGEQQPSWGLPSSISCSCTVPPVCGTTGTARPEEQSTHMPSRLLHNFAATWSATSRRTLRSPQSDDPRQCTAARPGAIAQSSLAQQVLHRRKRGTMQMSNKQRKFRVRGKAPRPIRPGLKVENPTCSRTLRETL